MAQLVGGLKIKKQISPVLHGTNLRQFRQNLHHPWRHRQILVTGRLVAEIQITEKIQTRRKLPHVNI